MKRDTPDGRSRTATEKLRLEIARRKATQSALNRCERERAALVERSLRMQERLRRLSHRLLSAQEGERLRISRDLHDAIGQTLAGINVDLATLQRKAVTDSAGLTERIAHTQKLVERSISTVHEFARELRPTVLDDLGLGPALRSHGRSFTARSGVRIKLSLPAGADAARLPPEIRTALFRVAQEALVNVSRHARAREVRVGLTRARGVVRLEVADDGDGFDVARAGRSKRNQHLGLLGMQERMDMVGGRLEITSEEGAGTKVRAEVPVGRATIG
jgi:signal transduction histidine kinase